MAKNNKGGKHPTRIYNTPEELKADFLEYLKELEEKATKWNKKQFVGKDGEERDVTPVLPFTLSGLYRFVYDKRGVFIEHYFTNQDGYYQDFIGICSYIRSYRNETMQTGGLTGHYNANLTARLTDAVEKQEVKVKKLGTDYDAEYVD